jgi:hypothetical protein
VRLERAAAVIWPRLRRLAEDRIPAQVQSALRQDAMLGDVRMTRLTQRLDDTLAALTGAGIPVILLKGAALGRTVYRSLPRRPMLDLDLLVPQNQLAAAREVVLASGWQPGPYEYLADTAYPDHYHLPPFADRDGGDFNLELHHGLFFRGHPFGLEMREVWEQAQPLTGAPQVMVPDPTHIILHLAVHFAWSHVMRSATWRTFRDLRVVLEHREIDWDRLVEAARRIRAQTCCYWTFRFAREWAAVPVPDAVLHRLAPPLPGFVLRVLARHFAQQWYPGGPACPSLRLDCALWRAAIRPRWSGHGGALPWQHSDRFASTEPVPRQHETTPHKLLRHLRMLRAYFTYVRGLLGSNGAGSS